MEEFAAKRDHPIEKPDSGDSKQGLSNLREVSII